MGPSNESNEYGTKLTLFASPLMYRKNSDSDDSNLTSLGEDGFGLGQHEQINERKDPFRRHEEDLDALPEFQRHEEATNTELFYDLFFVANLTTFSTIHEINDIETLTSYIGFFCILWFTWCQVSSFDVRFIADSVMERIAKAIHMGVMVGMATVGPNFDTHSQHASSLKTMALVLMVSRIVLGLQYLGVLWHVRKHRNTKIPFALIAAVNFISGIIYFAVSFTFGKNGRSLAYRSFYVLAVFEIVANILISVFWKVLTFKHTHLVQRMSLLTLIILGEGVIVVSKNIAKIVQKDYAWDTATIGTLTAAIAIIYFLYMLYFDALPSRHFGSIRQQIWAFMHFPFHLALILFMEGTAEFVIWHKMWDIAITYVQAVYILVENTNSTQLLDGQELGAQIANLTTTFLDYWPTTTQDTQDKIDELVATLQGGFNATFNYSDWNAAADDLSSTVMHSVFQTYGFEAPEPKNGSSIETPDDIFQQDLNVITLVYIYFFIAAGATLILMGSLNLLTLPRSSFSIKGLKHPGSLIRILAFFAIGLGIALSTISINFNSGSWLAVSPWLLPAVGIPLLAVVVVQYLPVKEFSREDEF